MPNEALTLSSSSETHYDPNQAGQQFEIDCLFRLYSNSSGKLNLGMVQTSVFKELFQNYFKQTKVLIEVIKSQKGLLEFNGYYTAFLLNQISEKQFNKISKNFTIEVNKDVDKGILANNINFLLETTRLSFTTQDLSDIFKCDEDTIIQTLDKI